jgi:hypothetical protein
MKGYYLQFRKVLCLALVDLQLSASGMTKRQAEKIIFADHCRKKRVVLFFALLIATSLTGFSQMRNYPGSISKPIKFHKDNLREKGLVIRPEAGLGLYSWVYEDQDPYLFEPYSLWKEITSLGFINIDINVGYQITPYIYVGGGIETFIGLPEPYYHWPAGVYCRDIALSLYSSFRWYWFKGVSSPYLELNHGVLLLPFDYGDYYFDYGNGYDYGDYQRDLLGLIIIPSLGWEINHFDIKASFITGSPVFHSTVHYFHSLGEWEAGFRLSIGYKFTISRKNKQNKIIRK